MEQVLQRFSLTRLVERMDVRGRIKRLPLPIQAFVNFNLAQLLALSIAIPDVIPLVDEVACGWLFYQGITATAQSVRERYGDRFEAWRRRRIEQTMEHDALPDLEQAEDLELEPSLVELTLREIEDLDPDVLHGAIARIKQG